MEIKDEQGFYWTENKTGGFWSKFEPLQNDKRNFFFLKAVILKWFMRMEGIKTTLEVQKR